MIAGGIGITPLLSMVRQLDKGGADWRLLYGGRRRASMGFIDDLVALGERVTIWPQDSHGLLDLDTLLAAPRAGAVVYCCGPEALIAAVEARCASWPRGALHIERFRPRPGALDGPSTTFDVVAARSGVTVTVTPDQTIVEALERAGVVVPTSCREGTCGTCESYVLEGIPDHRDSFLLDDEKEENATMMVCCSRSLSDRLVLDL
jgi:ferredoxin-NADP reductase